MPKLQRMPSKLFNNVCPNSFLLSPAKHAKSVKIKKEKP